MFIYLSDMRSPKGEDADVVEPPQNRNTTIVLKYGEDSDLFPKISRYVDWRCWWMDTSPRYVG